MSTISEFNTVSVLDKPQHDTFIQVSFQRPFIASPRLPHGIKQLDISSDANIRIKSTINDITETSAVCHIDSWHDTTLYSCAVNSLNLAPANLEFQNGEHTRDLLANPRDPASTRINFERPFITPPKVVVFFRLIDLDKGRDWRLRTSATGIDEKGFTLNIETWSDTILYAAGVGWIAYPEDRTHIFSISVNTGEIGLRDEPQTQHSKDISFGDVEFWKNPSVFVALNMFDLGCGHDFRLEAFVDQVTQQGLTWHLDSRSDTVLYSAGASIIAVN